MTSQPPTTDALYDSVVEALRNEAPVTQMKMFGSPGLKTGDKVFAALVKGKLVLKLPKERVAALVSSGVGEPFDPGMGRVMKQWVALKPSTSDEWLELAREAKDFVASAS